MDSSSLPGDAARLWPLGSLASLIIPAHREESQPLLSTASLLFYTAFDSLTVMELLRVCLFLLA